MVFYLTFRRVDSWSSPLRLCPDIETLKTMPCNLLPPHYFGLTHPSGINWVHPSRASLETEHDSGDSSYQGDDGEDAHPFIAWYRKPGRRQAATESIDNKCSHQNRSDRSKVGYVPHEQHSDLSYPYYHNQRACNHDGLIMSTRSNRSPEVSDV